MEKSNFEIQKLREKICQIIYGCSLEELRYNYELSGVAGEKVISEILNLILNENP